MEYFVAVFDNDDDDKLGQLKAEEMAVADSMTELRKAGWDAEVRGNMGGKSLSDLLGSVGQKMTVFHFSGHHGQGLLSMADGKVNAAPLIDFLNGCPNLKLVFINGCSSQNFVDGLHNVPVVIGTVKAIVDEYAKDVSANFYRQIQLHPERFKSPEDIEKLFNEARNLVNMNTSEDDQLSNALSEDESTRGVLIPWGGESKEVYKLAVKKDSPALHRRFADSVEVDVNKQLWERVQSIEEQIGYGRIKEGEFYKTYPYLFSQLLAELKPELSSDGGFVNLKDLKDLSDIAKLSWIRCVAICKLYYQLVTFLKFAAFSILWTLHNKKVQSLTELNADNKKLLKDYLAKHFYGPSTINSNIVSDLESIYGMIPFDQVKSSGHFTEEQQAVWVKMKDLVVNEQQSLKEMADLINSFSGREARDDKSNWLKAEEFLINFVTRDSNAFMRSLSIWSIYDIYYRQFRYRDEKELVFKRGIFPIETRPVAGKSAEDVVTLKPDDPIDYDVQSVYLVDNDKRVLNLTPFYVDMNASDENANKMDICYLEAYRENMDLSYLSLMDEEEHKVGKPKDDNEQKFIYDQVAHFWSLLT